MDAGRLSRSEWTAVSGGVERAAEVGRRPNLPGVLKK
jgi:hypothetical protein